MRSSLSQVVDALKSVLLGKEHQVQLALATLLAQGHLLIEDLPGMGKTTLALGLSRVLGLSHRRVQFTVDVLPSDITGMSMYRKETETFEFRPGPIFSHLLLTDEINRAMPKTQSALLEAMEEMTVSQDGENGQSHQSIRHGFEPHRKEEPNHHPCVWLQKCPRQDDPKHTRRCAHQRCPGIIKKQARNPINSP